MRENWRALGPSADLPGVRRDALLRRLTQSPRHQARAREQTSRDRVGRARGALVVLLSRRRFCGILNLVTRLSSGNFQIGEVTEKNFSCSTTESKDLLQAVAGVGKVEGWVSGAIFDMVESTRDGLLGFLDRAGLYVPLRIYIREEVST